MRKSPKSLYICKYNYKQIYKYMSNIKIEVREKLKASSKVKSRLAYEMNKHWATIDRWISEDSEMLTTKTALTAISEELGLKEKEILA